MILDSVITIQRLTKDVDNADKEMYQPNLALTSVKCNIQPASPEQVAISDGVFGQTFACFTTESGLLTGDLATVSGTGQKYVIRGIEDWSLPDMVPHYEVTMVKMEEDEV